MEDVDILVEFINELKGFEYISVIGVNGDYLVREERGDSAPKLQLFNKDDVVVYLQKVYYNVE